MNTRVAVLIAGAVFALYACGGGGGGSGSSSSGSSGGPAATAPVITGPASALPAATAGTAYAGATITASGTSPITFAVTAGSLPDGMALNSSTGAYSGTPLVLGNFAFTVTATNSAGTASTPYTQVVNPAVPNANLLLTSNRLVSFNTAVPTALEAPVALAGIAPGEELVAIARRPANGFLYGFAVDGSGRGTIYALHPAAGVATELLGPQSFQEPDGSTQLAIQGTSFGAHVAPGSDVLRVANNSGQNFRFDLNWGTRIDGAFGFPGYQVDGFIKGATDNVDSLAYTNNYPGTTVSTLYTIDPEIDSICIQNSANSGMQSNCLALSSPIDAAPGFDIAPGVNAPSQNAPVASGSATAVVRLAGQTTERLATIDLTNGVVSEQPPAIGDGGIRSLAIQAPAGIPIVALTSDGNYLLAFTSAEPSAAVLRTITGVAAGERLVGIDFRPSTGQLYGLGINSAADTGSLYIINPQTADAVTLVPGAIAFVSDTGTPHDLPAPLYGYGFAFSPSDHIRVVTGTDLNFRLDPGSFAGIDGNPAAAGVQADTDLGANAASAVSFTNWLDFGSNNLITTLYTVDAANEAVCIQAPANAGTMSSCHAMTINGALPNIARQRGFGIPRNVRAPAADAPAIAGIGYVGATTLITAVTSLYELDLATGVLTSRGGIGDGMRGVCAIALGLTTVR